LPPSGSLSFLEAALAILEREPGKPLHYKEITRLALEQGLVTTEGNTPDATMGAQLYSHVKRAAANSETPKVQSLGGGLFAINIRRNEIEHIVAKNNAAVKDRLLGQLRQMDPYAFEQLVGALLSSIGFEDVAVVGRSGDGSIDVTAELTVGGVTRVKTAVQVKRWKENVPDKIVRELRGGLQTDQRGLVITTGGFTKPSLDEAKAANKVPISLMDGSRLADLLLENQIGVTAKELTYFVIDLDQLEELDATPAPAKSSLALSLWPVPGGTRNYVDSAKDMVQQIASTNPTIDEMTAWMKGRFPKAKSDQTIRGYVRVLRTLGFISYEGERLRTTPEGNDLLSGNPKDIVARQLFARVAGVSDVFEMLKAKPMAEEEVRDELNRRLGTMWETTAQTGYRLLWLQNVGLIGLSAGRYSSV
jgi:hypothetical protein